MLFLSVPCRDSICLYGLGNQRECPVPVSNEAVEPETFLGNCSRILTQPEGFLIVREQETHVFVQCVNITGDIACFAMQNDGRKFSCCKGNNRHTNGHSLDYSKRQTCVANRAEQEAVLCEEAMQVPVWYVTETAKCFGLHANYI